MSTPPVVIEGTGAGPTGIKRFYVPGITVRTACPHCGLPWERNLDDRYLSHPTLGEPFDFRFYCDHCNEEWSAKMILRVSLELAP